MAKVKLGARPQHFKRSVKFPMVDGSTGAIECTFKYRTRKEFAKFLDSLVQDAKAQAEVAEAAKDEADVVFRVFDLVGKTIGANAKYIMAVLEGWDLDEDLTLENVEQLADEQPAAVNAIMETYRSVIAEGAAKN
jgi:hypothetical protein